MREAKTRNSGLSGDEYCAAENRMRKIEVHIFQKPFHSILIEKIRRVYFADRYNFDID